jgi:hypothetical protein
MKIKTSLVGYTVLVAGMSVLAANVAGMLMAPKPPKDKPEVKTVTYARDIRPVFEQACFKCHGPEKQKAKLRLDSLEAALKGGKDGKVIAPGHSGGSLLYRAVAQLGDPDLWMPAGKNAKPLPPEQVTLIKTWIDQGAK